MRKRWCDRRDTGASWWCEGSEEYWREIDDGGERVSTCGAGMCRIRLCGDDLGLSGDASEGLIRVLIVGGEELNHYRERD